MTTTQDSIDAARWRFTMEYQANPDREQPEPFRMMWLKVLKERRRHPTNTEYEAATDAAIALQQEEAQRPS